MHIKRQSIVAAALAGLLAAHARLARVEHLLLGCGRRERRQGIHHVVPAQQGPLHNTEQ